MIFRHMAGIHASQLQMASGGGANAFNPDEKASAVVLSNNDQTMTTGNTGTGGGIAIAVTGKNSADGGKWYYEIEFTSNNSGLAGAIFGASLDQGTVGAYDEALGLTTAANAFGIGEGGLLFSNGSNLGTKTSSYTAGDIVSILLNMDDNEVNFWINGTDQTATTSISLTGVWYPAAGTSLGASAGNNSYTLICASADFNYTPPAGYDPVV